MMEKHSGKLLKKGRGKLKESCDACAQTKVRCSKEKPICARCAAKSLCCGYSFSQRKGKQRATAISDSSADNVSLPQTPSTTSSTVLSSLVSNEMKEDVFNLSDQPSYISKILRPEGVSSTRGISPVESRHESRCIRAVQDSHETTPATLMPDFYVSSLSGLQPNGPMQDTFCDTSGSSFDYDCLLNFNGYDGFQVWDQELTDWSLGIQTQSWSTHNITSTPLPLNPPSLTRSSIEDNGEGLEDCTARALDMLRQLNIPQSGCSSQVEGRPSASHPTHDQALALTTKIVDSIHEIIQCSCSKQMLVAHLLTMLTIKVISWYEAALPDAAFLEGQTNTSISGVFLVVPPVAASGSRGVGDGKQRMQVVLTEIGRLHALVNALSDRFRSCGKLLDQETEAENGFRGSEIGVLKHSVLLSELERVIRQKERRVVDAAVQLLSHGV